MTCAISRQVKHGFGLLEVPICLQVQISFGHIVAKRGTRVVRIEGEISPVGVVDTPLAAGGVMDGFEAFENPSHVCASWAGLILDILVSSEGLPHPEVVQGPGEVSGVVVDVLVDFAQGVG